MAGAPAALPDPPRADTEGLPSNTSNIESQPNQVRATCHRRRFMRACDCRGALRADMSTSMDQRGQRVALPARWVENPFHRNQLKLRSLPSAVNAGPVQRFVGNDDQKAMPQRLRRVDLGRF